MLKPFAQCYEMLEIAGFVVRMDMFVPPRSLCAVGYTAGDGSNGLAKETDCAAARCGLRQDIGMPMLDDFSSLLAVAAGVVVTAAVLWPLLRYERDQRIQAEEALGKARNALSEQHLETTQLQEMLSATLDAYPTPVFLTDRDRIIVFANPAALELVRLPRDLVLG